MLPKDPKERTKLILSMAEQVKKQVDSGFTKMWGISAGGGHGFAISEKDPKELYGSMITAIPFIKFDVKPMLTIDEMIEVMKGMQ